MVTNEVSPIDNVVSATNSSCRPHCIDCVIVRIGGTRSHISCRILHARVVERNDIGCCDADDWRQRRRPCDPPSDELTALSVPFATVRSALVKPLTASENAIVTSEVSPIDSTVSATTIVDVSRVVSIA